MSSEIQMPPLAPDAIRAQAKDTVLAQWLSYAAQGHRMIVDEALLQEQIDTTLLYRGTTSISRSPDRGKLSPELAKVRAHLRHYGFTSADVFAMLAGERKCPTFTEILEDPLRNVSLTFPHHEFRSANLIAACKDTWRAVKELIIRRPQVPEIGSPEAPETSTTA